MIYIWTSKTEYKSYIGKTKYSPEDRLRGHLNDSANGSPLDFHTAIRKYGIDDFELNVLEEIFDNDNDNEVYWIDYYDTFRNGYNMTLGADGGNTGGMSEEVKNKKQEIGEDGLNDFQRQGIKAWKTRRERGEVELSVQKNKEKRSKIGDDGLTSYERSALKYKENWKNKSDEEKQARSEAIKEVWKNISDEKKMEFSKMRRIKAKEQFKNESQETKELRIKKASEASKNTVSAFNIKSKSYNRVSYEEWTTNPLLGGVTHYITKVTINDREIYLFNPKSYEMFAIEFSCKKDWVKGLSSDGIPFETPYKKFKHLEGLIRKRVLIDDLTADDIEKIEKYNYI